MSQWVILGEIFSTNHHSQSVKARELKLWEKVHLPPPVTCHMSCVKCHVSLVRCHMKFILIFLVYKVVKLVDGGSVINGANSSSFLSILTYYNIKKEQSMTLIKCLNLLILGLLASSISIKAFEESNMSGNSALWHSGT